MKFSEFELICEIGEAAVRGYDANFSKLANITQYLFSTESNLDYAVTMYLIDKTNFSIDFEVLTESGADSTAVTNRGELFRVMSTVIECIYHYIKTNVNEGHAELPISFTFDPVKKDEEQEKPATKTQRGKLYLAFVRKLIPSAHVSSFDNNIKVRIDSLPKLKIKIDISQY